MQAPSLDLTRLLPQQYRDKTLDTLLKGLFNRHLSKTDVLPLFGHVGDNLNLQPGDVQISETNLERQINQLSPVLYTEHGTEKILNSWPDILQKLVLLGVDYQSIDQWFTSKSYNFVPPIDLDKFCNFNQYFWIGNWINPINENPALPYFELGIPLSAYSNDIFAASNPNYLPEYYTIERGELGSSHEPLPPQPNMTTWSDWALVNLWVHRDDLITFLNVNGGLVSFGQLVQATRPIIEYSNKIKMNAFQTLLGVPADAGTGHINVIQRKQRFTQLPLFDLYNYQGEHTGQTSAIFYYQESSEFPVDPQLQRRLVTDINNDFVFEHALIRSADKELLFLKNFVGFVEESTIYKLKTIWRGGPDATIQYSKYDTSGTLINQDKFVNFRNYFWTGVDAIGQPVYNITGLPEYTVVEPGGTTNWSIFNHWFHVSQLKRTDLPKYVQATRPIIEFNKLLESEIIGIKTSLNELPKFRLYRFNDITKLYEIIPSVGDPNLNDAYLQGHLFARVAELPLTQGAITTTPEVLATCFEFNNEYYIQGLYTGEFLPIKNGIPYGYQARQVSYVGTGNGLISGISTDLSCIPQILTLTAVSPTSFSVVGTVTGFFGNATVTPPIPFSAAGANFTINAGSTPFVVGDTFTLELKSYVFNNVNVFINLSGVYRTLTSPSMILTEKQSSVIVPADTALLDGIWQVAPQIEWNVQNETRATIGQGDLYYHLTSIIKAQPGLIGGSTGNNNWRNLVSKNLGLGGVIKEYDGNTALLLSMLIQHGITPAILIEFARQGYEQLFSAVHNFVNQEIPTMLSNAEFTPPIAGDMIDPLVVERFKTYFANISPVVTSSATTIDDYVSTPFYDSTSSIQNLIVTLPYIGLVAPVLPEKTLDLELNMEMLVHHDGHRSKLPTVTQEIMKSLVMKNFTRSPGQQTPGLISGVNPPALPYKGQFWFKTATGELYFYNAISDTGEQPITAVAGNYSYDRSIAPVGTLTQFNGAIWTSVIDVTLPLTVVKLDLIEVNLLLAIEKELFNNCPPLTPRLNDGLLQANAKFNVYQQQEFEKFGVTYGVTDVYGTTYVPTNAFTWNYSSEFFPFAVWQEIYLDIYGTSRPDLQPWFIGGYLNEAAFLTAYDVYAANPPGTTTFFDPLTMWPVIAPFVHLSWPDALSVDIVTGTLLPPYSVNAEGLINVPPTSAANKFSFGDLGPIERYWRKTLNFLYSVQKSYFKIDPLAWVQETWGIKYEAVDPGSLDSGYVLNSYLRNKEAASDFMLHGDLLKDSPQLSWFTVGSISNPPTNLNYSITCVSRLDGVFKVVRSDLSVPSFITTSYSDAYISLSILPSIRGFFWGDGVNLVVHSDGSSTTVSLVYFTNLRTEGFNQIYMQYSRSYGDDLAISINKSLFSNWTAKLGYRFGGFVNTDSLIIKSMETPVVETAFNTYLKENKYYNSSWLNALRVQLVQRGSTDRQLGYDVPKIGLGGTPGEDWIFRVDNFNPRRPSISWYQYDLSGGYQDFIALDGKRSLFSWKHYGKTIGTISHNSPFLITGIQNVLNFIFGYSDLRAAEGWNFNDQENPVLDSSTGRPIGYQLLVEQFIAQQFSGAVAGSAFLFNPFSRKVWYKTPHGIVTDLFDILGLEQETVPTLLDSGARHIEQDKVRVFRQDAITEIVFDKPAFTVHLLTSEFEHVVLFENYSANVLLYDAFLGQKTGDVFLEGEKQTIFSGRMDFGGHFLLGDKMKRNIESSVQSILGLYDTTSTLPTVEEKEHARALLGFQKKQYFADRGTPDQTEFRFWQGLIANKGTNFSVDAYVNSQRFKNARLDEYWAYKLAKYGDARSITKIEMRTEPNDCSTEMTNYLFLEEDELTLLNNQNDEGYDIPDFDIRLFDSYSIYTNEQALGKEFFDSRGCIIIQPTDEARWFRYADLKAFEYFTADIIAEWQFVPDNLDKCYVVLNSKGLPVRADCFEIVDINYEQGNDGYDMLPYDVNMFDSTVQERYFEAGDYIPGSNPIEYSAPKFKRINSSTIQILDPILLSRPFKVIAYGPAIAKYSPNVLFDFQTNTTVLSDIIWWDPARGSHHPAAYREVDFEQPKDPARYNVGTLSYMNERLQKQKPWGENEVGKIWWNNFQMDWQFYSDTKIYPDIHERLARWGSPADFSEVQINEWVKSTMSPQDYEKSVDSDGEISAKYTLKRTRDWYQRVVAWRFSDNPATLSRKFITYQPSALVLSIGSDGYGTAILKEGNLADENLTIGCKITAALYSSTTAKTDANLLSVFGQANVLTDPSVIVGSSTSYDGGAAFATSASITLSLSINSQILSFRNSILGQYQLSNQLDAPSGKRYITLTHIASEKSQQLQVHDVPITAGIHEEYNFDLMGVIITYSTTFDRSTSTESSRIQSVAGLIGNVAHDIVLRSYVDIFSPIPFVNLTTTYTTLDGNTDLTTLGWVAWTDPVSNPGAGPTPPFNKYAPVLGDWILVGNFLSDIATDINVRSLDAWTGFETEDYNPYKSVWGPWKNILDEVYDYQYCTSNTFTNTQFFDTYFTLTGTSLTTKEILQQTDIYINNIKIRSDRWTLDSTGVTPVIRVDSAYLNKGDRVRAQIRKYSPTATDLTFNPVISDPDPLVLSQWAYDYPYVLEERRNALGGLTVKNYYFWIKNKTAPALNNSMGTKQIATLLRTHDGSYGVPQILKFYNQIDARPNRYGLLSLKNLGRYVRVQDTYKLRLTQDPTLRDDDHDLSLKNVHIEWQLLRQYQPSRIPRVLWDLLTDTLAGETALTEVVPFEPLENYDKRNGTTERYGFTESQQVLTDPAIAKDTLKYTVLNTRVDKYINGNYVIDPISYPGFDINNLDFYLSSPTLIREFMSNLWRYAKPKQLNEIFFAVLEDAAASNLELTDFFKTSFISLNDVQTIDTGNLL